METDWLLWMLFSMALLTAPVWAYDRFVFSKKRVVIGSTPWLIDKVAPWCPFWVALAVIKIFLLEPFQVPSSSMRPILTPGSVVISTKWDYPKWNIFNNPLVDALFEPRRGEVALFRYPNDHDSFFVKRIIGLPGDYLKIDLSGQIYVNGKPIKRILEQKCFDPSEKSERSVCFKAWQEQWEGKKWTVLDNGENLEQRLSRSSDCKKDAHGNLYCQVPSHCYFMMGDNRQDSFDSRDWGCANRSLLEGRARFEFSFSSFRASGWID